MWYREDKEKFMQKLLDAGCKKEDIRIRSLKDVAINPEQVNSFFKERFFQRWV